MPNARMPVLGVQFCVTLVSPGDDSPLLSHMSV